METQLLSLTPYENFLFGMKAKETRRQYPHRLDKFLTFMGIQGTIPEKCTKLYELANDDTTLFQSNIIRFINSQRERIETKDISEGTVCNYVKAIKLFCNMNDIVINWKKIGKGMPSEKHNADDRIPIIGEIHKLLEYHDRRLKPIVYVMISAGIRVGSWEFLKWKHVIPIKDLSPDTQNNVIELFDSWQDTGSVQKLKEILGPSKAEQVLQSIRASKEDDLTDEERKALKDILKESLTFD